MRKTAKIIIIICCMTVCLAFCLTACGDKCEHVYDDCADIECNECGEKRDSMHTWADADCDTPKTCKNCGLTEGEALGHDWKAADCITAKTCKTCGLAEGAALGHKPAEDDGDCTTAIQCTVCGEVTTAAKAQHILAADDGDCTTPITCTECTTVLTAAKSHDFTGDYVADETQHWQVCKNDGCNVTDEKEDHDPNQNAATVTAPKQCTICEYIMEPQLPHDHTYNVADYNDTHHYMRCSCGTIDETTKVEHSPISDNDCTTSDKCTCGHTVTAATNHVAGEDDGNCTTGIKCMNCEKDATSGTTEHIDSDHDHICDALGCQITLEEYME